MCFSLVVYPNHFSIPLLNLTRIGIFIQPLNSVMYFLLLFFDKLLFHHSVFSLFFWLFFYSTFFFFVNSHLKIKVEVKCAVVLSDLANLSIISHVLIGLVQGRGQFSIVCQNKLVVPRICNALSSYGHNLWIKVGICTKSSSYYIGQGKYVWFTVATISHTVFTQWHTQMYSFEWQLLNLPKRHSPCYLHN